MYNFTVTMALVDFIPVLLFGAAAILLLRDLKMGKAAYALFAAGVIDVFCAGFLKAAWKLLYAAGVCDFAALNSMFLPVQSIGFAMAGLGILLLLCTKKKKALLAVAPPVFSGSFVFIILMVLGLGCLCTCLSIIAAKMKKMPAVILFVLAFLFSMGMGAMSRQDSTAAMVNWIEQGINTASQACLLGGVVILHRAGLEGETL